SGKSLECPQRQGDARRAALVVGSHADPPSRLQLVRGVSSSVFRVGKVGKSEFSCLSRRAAVVWRAASYSAQVFSIRSATPWTWSTSETEWPALQISFHRRGPAAPPP